METPLSGRRTTLAFLLAAIAPALPAAAQTEWPPLRPFGSYWFGRAVATDGVHLAVTGTDGGHANYRLWLYERPSGASAWTLETSFDVATPNDHDALYSQNSLALDDNVMVVGLSKRDTVALNSGSAFVFEQTPNGWTQVAELQPSDPQERAWFGASVAVDRDTILVGAPFAGDGPLLHAGALYAFERDASGAWVETQRLVPPAAQPADSFGAAVDLDGDTAVVGAPGSSRPGLSPRRSFGALHVLERGPAGWSFAQRLDAANGEERDQLGTSVAIDGDVLAAGAPYRYSPQSGGGRGQTHVFERQGGVWLEVAAFEGRATAGDSPRAGWSVDVDGERVASGAPQARSGYDGDVELFERRSGTWVRGLRTAPTTVETGYYANSGYDVAVFDELLVIGAPAWGSVTVLDLGSGPGRSDCDTFQTLITPRGSDAVSARDLRLQVKQCDPGRAGQFFLGTIATQEPFGPGVGFLCIGDPARIAPTVVTNAAGWAQLRLDFSAAYAASWLPGTTVLFQFAYRLGGPSSQLGLSNSLEILWR